MRKRVYSFLLTLCMALSLFPALTPEASAGAVTKRISDALAFKQALEADGEVNIVVDADLVTSLSVGDTGAYYITLGTGRKYVNLNGHKVEYNVYFTSPLGSDAERTYIRVPTGAELIILDGSEDKSGKIWAYGKMHSPYDSYTKSEVAYRHVIEVDGGSLTVNGGLIEAGRTKTTWVYQGCNIEDWANWTFADLATIKYRFDGNAYEIVNGNAVTLNGGSVTINGGKLHGRGYRKLSSSFSLSGAQDYTATRAAAICATEGKVTLNGGQLYGAANANCLELGGKVEFELNRAFFETQELKTVLCPVDTPTYSHGQPTIAVIQSDWESYAVGHSSHRNSGAGAGSFNVPLSALSGDCFVWYDGNPYYSEDWNATRITKGDGTAHTLSVSRSGVSAIYASIARPLEGAQTVASVALDLTMARGLTLTGDTVKCSTTGVESVNTIWYRNSALITGPHEVSYGGYLAKVTVTAKKGYKVNSLTYFTIGGEKPTWVSAASGGSYAVVWSPAYIFECDHSMNVNPELHYDQNGHYVQCSVCHAHIGEEKHTLDAGVASGSVTTYHCLECDYSCQEENGYVKVDFLVADLPVAVGGSEIPTPAVKQEYARIAKVVSWEITDSSGSKLNPGDVYENGKSYTFALHVKPNDGYYFAPQTKMNCAATANGQSTVTNGELVTTYKVYAYAPNVAYVSLPAMAPGMTMGEYLENVEGSVNGKASGNIQATVSTHGQDDEVYVRKTLTGGWTLVRGASSLDAFWNTAIRPDTAYDVSVDFSCDGYYVPTDKIYYYSPASYEGYVIEGGETWYSVSAVVTSDPNTVSDIAVVSVTAPQTGATPEQDFDVLSHTALDVVKGGWNTTSAFSPQTAYTYTAVVKLRDEYSFASKVTGSVNGMPAQVKLSGSTATVTCTFPETEAAVTETQNAAAQDANNPFKDVTQKDAYYYEPILWAYSHQPQITTGTSADTFSPWMTCDRGQVVTFLWRAYGCPEPKSTENKFTDLTQDWYKKPIQWAVEQGITKGTSETTFTPAATCSVAETITFLYRAAGKPGATANPPMWYTDAMNWATGSGLVQNTSWNGVNPLVDCPRADIVTYLHRQLG